MLVSTYAEFQPIPEIQFADNLVASPIGTNAAALGGFVQPNLRIASFSDLRHRRNGWPKATSLPQGIVEAAQVSEQPGARLQLMAVHPCRENDRPILTPPTGRG